MVAPLVAGAARVAVRSTAKGTSAVGKRSKISGRASPIKHQRQLRRGENIRTYAHPNPQQMVRGVQKAKAKEDEKQNLSVAGLKRKAKVFHIMLIIGGAYIFAYGVQVAFGTIYVTADQAGLLGDLADTVSSWITGLTLKEIAQVIIATIGFLYMIAAILLCKIRGVNLDFPGALFVGAIAFAGYFAPYFFFLPWVLIWLFVVLISQK